MSDIPKMQFEACWCITNIASGSADNTKVVLDKGAIPILVELMRSNNFEVQEQAVWALGNIAGDNYGYRDIVSSHGAVEPLVAILKTSGKDSSMTRNASWTLSNLVRGKPKPDD
jgi:hypothetical protein